MFLLGIELSDGPLLSIFVAANISKTPPDQIYEVDHDQTVSAYHIFTSSGYLRHEISPTEGYE